MKVGDYAVLSGSSYSAVHNVIYKITRIDSAFIDVLAVPNGPEFTNLRRSNFTAINPDSIRAALIKTTAKAEGELQELRLITKEVDRVMQRVPTTAIKDMVMTIKDMLAYEEILSEQDIENVINGSIEGKSAVETLASLCKGHLDFGYGS